jgi:hypothetical protein
MHTSTSINSNRTIVHVRLTVLVELSQRSPTFGAGAWELVFCSVSFTSRTSSFAALISSRSPYLGLHRGFETFPLSVCDRSSGRFALFIVERSLGTKIRIPIQVVGESIKYADSYLCHRLYCLLVISASLATARLSRSGSTVNTVTGDSIYRSLLDIYWLYTIRRYFLRVSSPITAEAEIFRFSEIFRPKMHTCGRSCRST